MYSSDHDKKADEESDTTQGNRGIQRQERGETQSFSVTRNPDPAPWTSTTKTPMSLSKSKGFRNRSRETRAGRWKCHKNWPSNDDSGEDRERSPREKPADDGETITSGKAVLEVTKDPLCQMVNEEPMASRKREGLCRTRVLGDAPGKKDGEERQGGDRNKGRRNRRRKQLRALRCLL